MNTDIQQSPVNVLFSIDDEGNPTEVWADTALKTLDGESIIWLKGHRVGTWHADISFHVGWSTVTFPILCSERQKILDFVDAMFPEETV